MITKQICSVVNCDMFVDKRKDVCEKHYMRFRRNGSFYQKKPTNRPIEFEVNENGCFVVSSHAKLSTGYFQTGKRGTRKSMHRLIYEECFGDIQEGLVVRHKCDNRGCINPDHLELGTQADNVMDTVKRNRTLKGIDNPQSKLDEETVMNIKNLLSSGKRNCEIVKMLGINKSTICNIKRGAWKHVN